MALEPQKRVAEIVERYRLEPSLRDVYVEGTYDKQVIDWFLRESEVYGPVVYPIESIELPASVVVGRGFPNNNKGRVLALATVVASDLGRAPLGLTGIVDSDLDAVVGGPPPVEGVLHTDYSCIEMYAANAEVLRKFFGLGFDASASADAFIGQAMPVLHGLAVMRAANERLRWNMKQVDLTKSLGVTSGQLAYDETDHVKRRLIKNGRWSERVVFGAAVAESRKLMSGDPRLFVNGEEFVVCLWWWIRKILGKSGWDEERVATLLRTALEVRHLQAERLFQLLVERVKR